MRINSFLTGALAAGALCAPLLGASAAQAAPCFTASVSTYTAAGFSCTVNDVSFSGISVNTVASGPSAGVTLGNFTPFSQIVNGTLESGLSLNYSAFANAVNGIASTADVAWQYSVAGNLLTDAYLALAGNAINGALVTVNETLTNGTVISLPAPGSTVVNFAPIASLGVIKDQQDFSNTGGTALSSIVTNAFSTTTQVPVPEPVSLSLLGVGLAGLGIARRRKSV